MAKVLARPIRTRRDYKGAVALTDKTGDQTEPAAERRLQALLHEIEKFDVESDEDDVVGDSAADIDGIPRRRWSDELSDAE